MLEQLERSDLLHIYQHFVTVTCILIHSGEDRDMAGLQIYVFLSWGLLFLCWFLWELWTERAVTWPCVQQYGVDKRAVLWLPNGIIMSSCHKWTDPKLIQTTISGCDVIFKTIMVYVGGEGMTWTRGLLFFWINGSSHCCSLFFRAASLSHSIRYLCYKCSDGMHVL